MQPDTTDHHPAPPVRDPVGAALRYISSQQSKEGSWKGDYGGPLFLLPLYVITHHIMRLPIEEPTRGEMVRYLRNHINSDGGWGLHVEGHTHVYTTSVNYVAMRLLGVGADDPALQRARHWLREHGGPLSSATWGKFCLALLGLYDYRGLNPVPPELWVLPESLPLHPSRLWCHCRMVYLPMSYLYGRRAVAQPDELLTALRSELYDEEYDQIDWAAARNRVADTDSYVPHTPLARAANAALTLYERRPNPSLRQRALDTVLDQIDREDQNTSYICIGPINKLLNALSWYFARPDGPQLNAHIARMPDYLYQASDGIKMNGYNGSELWDTTFMVQAVVATGRQSEFLPMLLRAHRYIERTQVLEDVPQRGHCYRHRSKGGWPFSTRDHGWPITDCTAEGIKSSLLLQPWVNDPLDQERLTQAVDLLLGMQNADGGWATYEPTRGPRWLEWLNPSDCFADIMVDYSYVECTAASLQALTAFDQRYPGVRTGQIHKAVERGRDFILNIQRDDGSWEGSWGICFTYGTWFGVSGLRAAGLSERHPAIRSACEFLLSKQRADGSWGEHADSCRQRRYVETESGQAVMTSWAVLALIAAGHKQSPAVRRALRFLADRQQSDGSYPAEHIAGMFNKTCAIHYDNYLQIFPLWALALGE